MNDTTRQMGGALGVAMIGSMVTSVYASRIDDVTGRFELSEQAATTARSSLAGALQVAGSLGDRGAAFALDARESFVVAFHNGQRLGAAAIVLAALIVFRYLPARAPQHPVRIEMPSDGPLIPATPD